MVVCVTLRSGSTTYGLEDMFVGFVIDSVAQREVDRVILSLPRADILEKQVRPSLSGRAYTRDSKIILS